VDKRLRLLRVAAASFALGILGFGFSLALGIAVTQGDLDSEEDAWGFLGCLTPGVYFAGLCWLVSGVALLLWVGQPIGYRLRRLLEVKKPEQENGG